jgi:hypothetical protein
MGRSRWLGAWLAVGLGVAVGVAPALADAPAQLDSVTIPGDAVVGTTLTAAVVAVGDPAPAIGYEWARCDGAQPNRCSTIAGANAASYTVADSDLAHRLVVRVTAKNTAGVDTATSAPTALVGVAAQPAIPGVDFVAAPLQAPVAVSAPLHARYLLPFPVIRVAGSSVSGGAYINVLRVTAPRRTHVAIDCLGRGCPVRRLSRGPGRVPQLERFLPAGVDITIRATRGGYIGKYVRFIVRSHAAPERRDACLMPGRPRPARCP